MPEFSFSSTCNKKNEYSSTTFLSHFLRFCFSILSHPLYFSYFIFFSPHFLRLLSFLSPLFITTTLLLLALLTLSPKLVRKKDGSELSESKLGFLLSVFQTLVQTVSSKDDHNDDEIGIFEGFQAYLDVFQAQIFEATVPNCSESESFEAPEAGCSGEERDHVGPMEEPNANLDENPVGEDEDDDKVEAARPIAEVKSLENLFHENNRELEDMVFQKEDKEVKPLGPEPNKAEESKEKLPLRSGSKVGGYRKTDAKESADSDGEYSDAALQQENVGSPESNREYSGRIRGTKQPLWSSLGSYGSMRKEREWRRTLACKLYEERHNVGGIEGMDLLWETYETEPNKVQEKGNTENGKKGEVDHSEDNDDDEEEEDGKPCCFQALKLSAGKMNLGMGRPNLVKISKALKGIGWLHRVSRHAKKRVSLS